MKEGESFPLVADKATWVWTPTYTRHQKMSRNYDYGMGDGLEQEGMLSIFNNTGRSYGRAKSRYYLDDHEYHAAHTYILLNCEEVKPYIKT